MVAEVETILQEMTRRLVAEFQPCQIYLFGSHAWGKPNEDSDLPIAKDVLVQTQAELERTSRVYASLQCEILERGVKVYETPLP